MAGDGLRAFLLPVLIGNWWEVRLLGLPVVYMEMISEKRIAAIGAIRFLRFSIRAVHSDNSVDERLSAFAAWMQTAGSFRGKEIQPSRMPRYPSAWACGDNVENQL